MADLLILQVDGDRAVAVSRAHDKRPGETLPVPDPRAAVVLAALAAANPKADVAWLDVELEAEITPPATWLTWRRHPLELIHLGDVDPASPAIASLGWVECEAPYLLPTHGDRRRATCLVSPRAGLVRAAMLHALGFEPTLGLSAALVDVALRGMAHGVFPMAEPRLHAQASPTMHSPPELDAAAAAGLLRRYLDRRWVGVWFLAHALFRHRLPVIAALRALATPTPRSTDHAYLARLRPEASATRARAVVEVVIPTLGRPRLLANVLDDLAAQTEPPRRVIIVDQHPSPAEDDTAQDNTAEAARDQDPEVMIEPAGDRPFEVERLRVGWMGACRARNLGLSRTRPQADWVLLLDDDIRFGPDLIAGMRATAGRYGAQAINPRVYLPGQDPAVSTAGLLPRLWPRFAGVALLSRAACDAVGGFDRRLDGGYGEDFDYGMRLRRQGFFVVYDPDLPVLHLHAPRGGFRTHHPHPWPTDGPDAPKPSPTVLLSRRLHQTETMRQGFLLFYVLAHLRSTRPWHWFRSVPRLVRRWRASVHWTDRLARRTSVRWAGDPEQRPSAQRPSARQPPAAP